MVSALNKKLIRELWRLRGQVVAIAMVIACGVATLVMALSTVEALQVTTQAYYDRYHFGDVFATVTRAPERLKQKIAEIPGVQAVQTRITRYATVDIKNFEEPVVGLVTSIPESGQPRLSQLVIRSGRWVSPGRDDEVILAEPFAEAHGLKLGDSLSVIMNGHKRSFQIVGIALCPEFIYNLAPGALMPDDKRFGVLWMGREVLAAAFDQDEAFNDVTLKLLHNVAVEPVLERLDVLLEKYGGTGAIARADQISNWFVMNEITQQLTMARILPTIFITVAIFLTNMVLARLIATERNEIGLLKAFGYSNWEIAWHYIKMMLVISAIGVGIGSLIGMLFGRMNTEMYATLFRFPLLIYRPSAEPFLIGGILSTIAALVGALSSVNSAVKLPPAEAMQPPSPPVYRHSIFTHSRFIRWLDQPTRIALRQIGRFPVRSFFTSAGIALSVGLMIMILQWDDSLNHMAQVNFYQAQRQNVVVGLVEPQATRSLHDFEQLPGVIRAEPMRMVGADFIANNITHRGGINGIRSGKENLLQPVYDDIKQEIFSVPENGLVLSMTLAKKLKLNIGDKVLVEFREGRRPKYSIPVVGIIKTYIGTPAYMNLSALNRLLKERPRFSHANLLVDRKKENELFAELKNTPRVSAVMLKQAAIDSFYDILVKHLMVFISMFTGLAFILGFGVAYNSTRISLSERGRELATLRVLGFSRGEISYVLLCEVAILILLGLPLGCLVGWGLSWSMTNAFGTELFRVPQLVEASTYGAAAVTIILSTIFSAALVRRKLDKLDLIRVLKTRE